MLLHTQRLAGVGTLTASVAHELTNPLSIITATCSNLLHEIHSNNLDTEMLLHYIGMIEQSAWRSTRIVEVLRHYTYDAGLQTAVTNLNMVTEDTLTLLRPQFLKEYNVRIYTELAETLPSIVCDHNRLTQVLINLMNNARDAMQPAGGNIYVKTWTFRDKNEQGGEQLALSVRDEGPGIPPELRDQIFEQFFTTKSSDVGTGLGLFVARELVEQHNGRIWCENHPHGGAIFTILLPQRQ
jgi:signal transduction histidine kinase